jgi:hypothetical protein
MMTVKPGKAEHFSPYNKKSRELINRIQRETDYRKDIAEKGYMAVEISGSNYALRLEDGRRFILEKETVFKTTMITARKGASANAEAAPPPVRSITPAPTGSAAPGPTVPPRDAGDATFQAPRAALLKKRAK